MLKGFGLFFFATVLLVEEGRASPLFDSRETSDCDGPPTAFLAIDLSRLDSVCAIRVSILRLKGLKPKESYRF